MPSFGRTSAVESQPRSRVSDSYHIIGTLKTFLSFHVSAFDWIFVVTMPRSPRPCGANWILRPCVLHRPLLRWCTVSRDPKVLKHRVCVIYYRVLCLALVIVQFDFTSTIVMPDAKKGRDKGQTTTLPLVRGCRRHWRPGHASAAESAGLTEHGDEMVAEVETHEALEPAHGNATDEKGGKPATPRSGGGLLLVGLLQLDRRRVRAHGRQKPLHDVAHAASSPAEDDGGVLLDEAPHPLLRRLLRSVD
ncbi:hypothetical protein BHE74_00008485 [Ensete ventricosum]|nr:hypothetical protein BHE74_00008485 [Ensete ventricosum]